MMEAAQESLSKLLSGNSLREGEACRLFREVFQNRIRPADAKSILLLLAKRGESAPEVSGCLKALLELEPPRDLKGMELIDTCGTGGDGSHSFNISSVSAFVIAGAGGRVAKHGNRAISSKCGSSDLFETLGVSIDVKPQTMIRSLKKCGLGYFHAPFYHPVFARVQPLRRSLKTRTIFNYLGPLVNPFTLSGQVLGVSRKENLGLFAAALKKKGIRFAMVCHSRDGMDEISTKAPTDVVMVRRGRVSRKLIQPSRYGFKKPSAAGLKGGTPKQNAALAVEVLKGGGPRAIRDIIILNAAAGIWVCGLAGGVAEGIEKARQALDQGLALEVLESMKKITAGGG